MIRRIFLKVLIANSVLMLIVAASLLPSQSLFSAAVDSNYTAVSTKDVNVATDELQWLVKPLTKAELVVESEAWRDILKLKAVEISTEEIEVRRENDQIHRTKKAMDATQEGQVAIEVAHSQEPDSQSLAVTTIAALRNAEVAAEEKGKAESLNVLSDLRTQRAALIERFNVVLNELKSKGGEIEEFEKYRDSVDEVIVDVSDTSAAWSFAEGWLKSEKGGILWAINISKFVSIMVVFCLLAFIAGKAVDKVTDAAGSMSQLLKAFIRVSVRRAVTVIGLLIAITSVGVEATPLLAIITAAGLVIGLALQNTLSNFASGLLLLLYRPFDVGDFIDAAGTAGTVDSMNIMSTMIRSVDNKVLIVPNNSVWANIITNFTRTNHRRVDLVFGIGYSDSMDQAQSILEKILKDHPDVLKTPEPVVRVCELGDSSVNFVVRPWVKPEDYWDVHGSITRKVKEEFDKQGVSIPFPQRDVHFYQESKGTMVESTDSLPES